MLKEAKRFAGDVGSFYGDQSKWQEQIRQSDTGMFLKEISRNRRRANIEESIGYCSFMGGIIGMSISVMFLNIDLARGLVFSTLATGFVHLPTKAAFHRRTEFLDKEASVRKNQAIFYQDVPTLAALEDNPS